VLTDGTYVLVSLTDYAFNPTGFPPARQTARVDGAFLELADESSEPVGVKVTRAKFRVTTKGNVLSLSVLCTDPPMKGRPAAAASRLRATRCAGRTSASPEQPRRRTSIRRS